ncbi:MAG TPA: hypothetical protein VK563_22770 [Puia sp.]|nr:hypothetical protein [Puia sp.]
MDITPNTTASPPGIPQPGSGHPAKRDLLAVLMLMLICCIAYWPLVFHVFSLKNDALSYFLPVRFQVSEAIFNHEYPFWSPYFNLGYALHGDMQSGVWNPVVQFISLFGPYSLYTLQLETVLYIFLSGVGMYFLLRRLGLHIYAVMFGAAGYMLCGFNTDSCQYINWLSGAAFLPFVMLFYYRMLKEKKILLSLLGAFSLYLLFVCAYPAQFIITLYLLLSIFIVHVISQRKSQGISLMRSLGQELARHTPFLICFVLLSLPAILSYYQYLPLSERGSGASYADAMSNPLHPLLLFAWLTPLPVYHATFATITDGAERNSYFGIIVFLFTLTAYFIRTSDRRVKFAKIAAIVSLILSLGEFGGLRVAAYYILPLMNAFRHPSGFKVYTIFFSCVLAAWSLDVYIRDRSVVRKVRNACFFCMGILGLLLLFSLSGASGIWQKVHAFLSQASFQGLQAMAPSLKQLLDSFRFKEVLLFNAAVQLFFLWLFYRYAIVRKNYKAVVKLSMLNCLLFTLLFLPATVVKKDSATKIQRVLDENIVYGYPLPSLVPSLADNSSGGNSRFQEIGYLNMYNKKPGWSGYDISPCNLLSQTRFWFDTAFRNTIMNYPLLYTADTLMQFKDSLLAPSVRGTMKLALVGDSALSLARPSGHTHNRLSVLSFRPNHFVFASESDAAEFHVLLQNWYPLWKLKIDGMERPIVRADISFMGFSVPAGRHKVEFLYSDNKLVIAVWLNILLTLVMLGILFYHGFSRSSFT